MTYTNTLGAALVLVLALCAQSAAAEGDAEKGAAIGYSCLGCHGIDGYRNAYPSYRVPRIGGQKRAYVEDALRAYRDGTRKHPTMNAQGGSLTDDDIQNIAAWLETYGEVTDDTTIESVAGIQAAQACVACHGSGGAAVMPVPPILAGQQMDYLQYALSRYRDGSRTYAAMNAFAAALSDDDIEAISRYYSSKKGLFTPKGEQ